MLLIRLGAGHAIGTVRKHNRNSQIFSGHNALFAELHYRAVDCISAWGFGCNGTSDRGKEVPGISVRPDRDFMFNRLYGKNETKFRRKVKIFWPTWVDTQATARISPVL